MKDREEHVKRSRITYDRNGGQTPNISPNAVSFSAGIGVQQEVCYPANSTASPQASRNIAPVKEDRKGTEADETSESSLTSWLFEKASKALFGE